MPEWFDAISDSDLGSTPTMDVDYELYAEGEALLGWLNCTVSVSADEAVDGNALLQSLRAIFAARLTDADAEIAHLKMTLTPGDGGNDIAVLNIVRNEQSAELSHTLAAPIESGELILNLRAEADPEKLAEIVNTALATTVDGASLTIMHLERFRPGKPQPTHRFSHA